MGSEWKLCLLMAGAAVALLPGQQQPPFSLPDSVEMQENVVYATIGERKLRLDLFLPKSGQGPFPAVVYIHGGGWRGGNKRQFQRHAAHMATKGFAGACIEYRLSGEAKFPAAVHDVKSAVRWIRAHAAQYRIDPGRIGAAGGSAGGHLAAILGTTSHVREFEGGGSSRISSRVQAVAAFNPALDFASFGRLGQHDVPSGPVYLFLGASFQDNPQLWKKASPIAYASKDSAPFLFLHGTEDTTVPYQQSVDMMNALKAAGVQAELFTAEGAGHGFFNRPPWFEPALKRMEEFFTRTLK